MENRALIWVSLLQSLLKGFSVLYFLFLPILYAVGTLGAIELGYVGASLIVGVLIGALIVMYKFHVRRKIDLLYVSFGLLLGGTLMLFWYESVAVLFIAYLLIGLSNGIGLSTINALAAQFTEHGRRYKSFAKMAMFMDAIRIVYPLAASAIYLLAGFIGLIVFALVAVAVFGGLISLLAHFYTVDEVVHDEMPIQNGTIRRNRPFLFVMALEFLDSFASSQLFVFLPALLVFKHFTIENALIMQSVVFAGYLAGRWLVGSLAHFRGGFVALGLAEVGMIITIAFILLVPPSILLYLFCFLLGVFTRGTSPVIKALAFDRLPSSDMRRGTAVHVISGDSGSAIGQLVFAFLLAWFGVAAPFWTAALVAFVIALACFMYRDPQVRLVG